MQIRAERPGDEGAIARLISDAFLEAEHRGGNEAAIVAALREAGSLALSLVAVEESEILGHAAFSPVTIDGRLGGWFGLGPLAVAPRCQRRGIGRALVDAGLASLRESGAKGCVVLGDSFYYGRFGFACDPDLRLAGMPPDYFQRLSFDGRPCSGMVEYHPAFAAE